MSGGRSAIVTTLANSAWERFAAERQTPAPETANVTPTTQVADEGCDIGDGECLNANSAAVASRDDPGACRMKENEAATSTGARSSEAEEAAANGATAIMDGAATTPVDRQQECGRVVPALGTDRCTIAGPTTESVKSFPVPTMSNVALSTPKSSALTYQA
jgi:hypothetical protein